MRDSEGTFVLKEEAVSVAVTTTLTVLLALVFLAAGLQKVLLLRAVTTNMRRLGAGSGLTRTVGALELLGVAGIVVGFWYPLAGVAATIGFVLVLAGAIGYHARAGDYGARTRRGDAFAPPVLLVLAGLLGALLAIG
jgi:uncharacterized membrane protein YphA (DoxX/SURF4 family)